MCTTRICRGNVVFAFVKISNLFKDAYCYAYVLVIHFTRNGCNVSRYNVKKQQTVCASYRFMVRRQRTFYHSPINRWYKSESCCFHCFGSPLPAARHGNTGRNITSNCKSCCQKACSGAWEWTANTTTADASCSSSRIGEAFKSMASSGHAKSVILLKLTVN